MALLPETVSVVVPVIVKSTSPAKLLGVTSSAVPFFSASKDTDQLRVRPLPPKNTAPVISNPVGKPVTL